MFKSFIKLVISLVAYSVAGLVLMLGYTLLTSPKAHKSAFTHEEIAKINPVMVIDKYTLVHQDNYAATIGDFTSRLGSMGVVIQTPFGPVINEGVRGYVLNIIIQSGGGLVALGTNLTDIVGSLREKGIKINCYVGEAQSMAFYIMTTSCDKVIAKRPARLMQHRVSYGASGTTPATYQSDIELSRKESQALGVSYDEWHNLARGEEDHVFNLLEIEKYKLVDEWID